jgi:hypothetical protein
MYLSYSSFELLISLLFGAMIGQFGYGTGVLLLLAAALLWGGDAFHIWINSGGAVFLVRTFVMTGLVAIATHFIIAFYRQHNTSGRSKGPT